MHEIAFKWANLFITLAYCYDASAGLYNVHTYSKPDKSHIERKRHNLGVYILYQCCSQIRVNFIVSKMDHVYKKIHFKNHLKCCPLSKLKLRTYIKNYRAHDMVDCCLQNSNEEKSTNSVLYPFKRLFEIFKFSF